MTSTLLRLAWRGRRRQPGVREFGSAVTASVVLAAQLVTLACGMLNPAFAPSDHESAAPDGPHRVVMAVGHEVAPTDGVRELPGHGMHEGHHPAPGSDTHSAGPDGSEAHDSAGHHGSEGDMDHCLEFGACGGPALDASHGPGTPDGALVDLTRRDGARTLASVVLALHRPPPKAL